MPFAVAGAAVSVGAGLIGSKMQSDAIKNGQSQANEAIKQGVDTATQQLSPWATAGQNALAPISEGLTGPTPWQVGGATDVGGQLSGIYGPDQATAAMANFRTDPGYQFRFDEGVRATDAAQASNEMFRSGATGKALEKFGQSLADQSYQTYLANANTAFGNYYNKLQALSGQGLTAAGGIATAATGGAANIAATDRGAAGQQSNIIGNEASSIGTTANGLLNNQGFQSYLKGIGGGGGSAGYDPSIYGGAAGTAGGAGTGALQSLGFYKPLGS